MTRWHGTSRRLQSRMMLPTARAARARPASAATSPYVETRPGGIRRTAINTRAANAGVEDRSLRPLRSLRTLRTLRPLRISKQDAQPRPELQPTAVDLHR